MHVFDDGPWGLRGGADQLVPHFGYLNSSARVEAARVRAVVELMFDRYPAQTQKALRRRLRSADNNTHLGAFLELALHDLLLRSGCRMLAVEPDLEDTLRSPDFLAETPQGQRFYLEATLSTGRSRSEEGAEAPKGSASRNRQRSFAGLLSRAAYHRRAGGAGQRRAASPRTRRVAGWTGSPAR
jgi:hypothetical protein